MISVWGVVIFIDWQGHPFQNLPKIPGSVWIRPAKSAFSLCVQKFHTILEMSNLNVNCFLQKKIPTPQKSPKAGRIRALGPSGFTDGSQDPSYSEPWYKAVRGLEASNGNEAGYANSGAGGGYSSLELEKTNGKFFGLVGWFFGWLFWDLVLRCWFLVGGCLYMLFLVWFWVVVVSRCFSGNSRCYFPILFDANASVSEWSCTFMSTRHILKHVYSSKTTAFDLFLTRKGRYEWLTSPEKPPFFTHSPKMVQLHLTDVRRNPWTQWTAVGPAVANAGRWEPWQA